MLIHYLFRTFAHMTQLQKYIQYALLTACCLCNVSCSLFDYHPYDGKVSGATGINSLNISRIESNCTEKDTIRFAVISDTQRWYDETQILVDTLNKRTDIDFVIHCGDLTDFGATREFEWQRDILQKLRSPYVTLIGNHDCLATGLDTFKEIFGTPNFSFNASFIHFVCLNTNAMDADNGINIPDFGFLQNDLLATDSQQTPLTIMAMHAAPGSEQFNNGSTPLLGYFIQQYPHTLLALYGHGHHTEVTFPLGQDGIPFYECGAANSKNYLIFTVTRQGYAYEAHSM